MASFFDYVVHIVQQETTPSATPPQSTDQSAALVDHLQTHQYTTAV